MRRCGNRRYILQKANIVCGIVELKVCNHSGIRLSARSIVFIFGRIWLLFAHLNWVATHGQRHGGKHFRHRRSACAEQRCTLPQNKSWRLQGYITKPIFELKFRLYYNFVLNYKYFSNRYQYVYTHFYQNQFQ